jgi:hypothetical protein
LYTLSFEPPLSVLRVTIVPAGLDRDVHVGAPGVRDRHVDVHVPDVRVLSSDDERLADAGREGVGNRQGRVVAEAVGRGHGARGNRAVSQGRSLISVDDAAMRGPLAELSGKRIEASLEARDERRVGARRLELSHLLVDAHHVACNRAAIPGCGGESQAAESSTGQQQLRPCCQCHERSPDSNPSWLTNTRVG